MRRSSASGTPSTGITRDHFGPAPRQRAGLVEDDGVDLLQRLERRSAAEQQPGLRATAHRDRHRHGRGEPQRTGASNDQRADGDHQRVGQPRLGADQRPDDRRDQGDADHRRHEPGGNPVGQRLHRRATALRFAHRADDLREQRVVTDVFGAQRECALAIDRAADQRRARRLVHRHRLSCQHRLVHGTAAVGDDTVDWNFFPGAHPQQVAGPHLRQVHFHFAAVGLDARGLARRQVEQCAQRSAGLLPGAQLEHLAQQYQRDDRGGRFEVQARRVAVAERVRNGRREQHREYAEAVGHGDTQRNQGEHVETAPAQRMPAPLQQRRAAPGDDRRGQRQLQPAGAAMPQRRGQPAEHASHRQRDQRHRKDHGPAQPLPHVEQLRVVTGGDDGNRALERHAAVRTGAGYRAGDSGHIGQM